jgi:hypothetical protein
MDFQPTMEPLTCRIRGFLLMSPTLRQTVFAVQHVLWFILERCVVQLFFFGLLIALHKMKKMIL